MIGGPFEGNYRCASVIHDIACVERARDWRQVHETFYLGMLASGVDRITARLMYGAVYWFGPRWAVVDAPAAVTQASADSAGPSSCSGSSPCA